MGADKMALKALAAKPGNRSVTPRTHLVEGESRLLQVVLSPDHAVNRGDKVRLWEGKGGSQLKYAKRGMGPILPCFASLAQGLCGSLLQKKLLF